MMPPVRTSTKYVKTGRVRFATGRFGRLVVEREFRKYEYGMFEEFDVDTAMYHGLYWGQVDKKDYDELIRMGALESSK